MKLHLGGREFERCCGLREKNIIIILYISNDSFNARERRTRGQIGAKNEHSKSESSRPKTKKKVKSIVMVQFLLTDDGPQKVKTMRLWTTFFSRKKRHFSVISFRTL